MGRTDLTGLYPRLPAGVDSHHLVIGLKKLLEISRPFLDFRKIRGIIGHNPNRPAGAESTPLCATSPPPPSPPPPPTALSPAWNPKPFAWSVAVTSRPKTGRVAPKLGQRVLSIGVAIKNVWDAVTGSNPTTIHTDLTLKIEGFLFVDSCRCYRTQEISGFFLAFDQIGGILRHNPNRPIRGRKSPPCTRPAISRRRKI